MTGNDAGKGTLVAALAEAAFLIGLERNRLALLFLFNCRVVPYNQFSDSHCLWRQKLKCDNSFFIRKSILKPKNFCICFVFGYCSDVVEMASCAPLFVNDNDRRYRLSTLRETCYNLKSRFLLAQILKINWHSVNQFQNPTFIMISFYHVLE